MLNTLRSRSFLEQTTFFLLAATLLALPLSSSAKSICLGLSVGAILLSPIYRKDLMALLKTTWCKSAILLFIIAITASLWSPAKLSDLGFVIEKYSKLLYLPILVVGFQNHNTRQAALHAFLLAMLITCGLSILKFHGFLNSLQFNPDQVFRNHIMTSFMTSFATYIALIFAFNHTGSLAASTRNDIRLCESLAPRKDGIVRLIYCLISILFTYQVFFISCSRTGYIIFSLLITIFVIQHFTWRQALGLIGIIYIAFITCYFLSPIMKQRVNEVKQQIYSYQYNNKNTDIGLRLQFHQYARDLFYKHPVRGNGTSSFTYYFDQEKPVPMWNWRLWEPHSQYWLVASEWGIIGLMALFLFFGSLIRVCNQLTQMKLISFAMIITFLIGNLSDSLLFYSGSGYFFILFIALCLGETVENTKYRGV